MRANILRVVAVMAVVMVTCPAMAQITVLATGSGTSADATYTTNELGNFVPPAGTDKLVVTLNDEENGFASGATYNGAAMNRVLDKIGNRYVTFFYLDYESVPAGGDLVFSGGGAGSAVAIFALQGTADGYAAKAGISSGTSIDFDAKFDGSFVAAGLTYDGTAGTGQVVPPLTPMIEDTTAGSASFVSGYTNNVASGTNTYSFVNTPNGGVAAVAFAAVGEDDIDPVLVSTSATDDGGNPTNSLTTDPVLTFTFDEPIFAGTGDILLKESGGATAQTYDVTNAYQLGFNVTTLTITPDVLDPETSYYVQIPNGALEDGSGNSTNYPDSALTFTTGPFLTVAVSNGKTTYTTNDLRCFDPTGYDKLVVCAMAESSYPTTLSWGSSNLTLIAQNADGNQRATMWFLDGPFTGPESFSVNNSAVGLSFVALSGTAPGVAAFDNVTSSSNVFTTTSAESFVVAGFNKNGQSPTPTADPPLTNYFSRATASGSSSGGSGVMSNSTEGAQTFSFSHSVSLVMAEFVVGSDVDPPRVASVSASDDAGNPTNRLLTDAILALDFTELIYAGTGSILLRKEEDDAIVETYDVTSSTKLAFSVGRLTITPNVLVPETSYYVQIPSGTVEDGAGNSTNYPDSTFTFTTGPWLSLALDSQSVYSTTDLRGFDPSSCDKLVVIAMAERSTFPGSVSWGSSNLTLVASNKTSSGNQSVAMWYGDGPFSGPDSLTVAGGGYSISLLGLQGTDPGVATYTNVSSSSVDLLTTSHESFVVAGYNHNNGTPSADAPLDTYFSRSTPNAYGASGAMINTTEALQSFSFTPVNNPSMVVAEFVRTPSGGGTLFIFQ